MNETGTIEKLRGLKPVLAAEMKISRLRVFGSFARGDETAESDIDLLVDFSETPGLFAFIGFQRKIGEEIGRRVDLVTTEALHPMLKDRILREAVDV